MPASSRSPVRLAVFIIMVILTRDDQVLLQGAFTPSVHAHVGTTQGIGVRALHAPDQWDSAVFCAFRCAPLLHKSRSVPLAAQCCVGRYFGRYDKLKNALELYDSRVSQINFSGGVASVHFSHAYIHKSTGRPGRDHGTGWSQEARLILSEVESIGAMPSLPNTISEGFLEVGGIKHELIPLPFKRKVCARLSLVFVDGARVEIVGSKPFIELSGAPIYLEGFS